MSETARTLRRIRRVAFHIEKGLLGGLLNHRSRIKTRGDGELGGHAPTGRIQELDFTLSAREDDYAFFLNEISLEQGFRVLVDMRAGSDRGVKARLIQVVHWTLGALLAIPDASISVEFFGARPRVRPHSASGLSQWPQVSRSVEQTLALPTRIDAPLGEFRRVIGCEEQHLILITPWIDPSWLDSMRSSHGCSLILVGQRRGTLPRGGVADWRASIGSRVALDEALETKHAELLSRAREMRIRSVLVDGNGDPLEAFERATHTRNWKNLS